MWKEEKNEGGNEGSEMGRKEGNKGKRNIMGFEGEMERYRRRNERTNDNNGRKTRQKKGIKKKRKAASFSRTIWKRRTEGKKE